MYEVEGVDRNTLRAVNLLLGQVSIVDNVVYRPNPYRPRSIRAEVDNNNYSYMDVCWFQNSDFSIRYVEEGEGQDSWWCSWEDHPSKEMPAILPIERRNRQIHFHHPPNGQEIDYIVLDSLHPLKVVLMVLAWIEQRIE